MEKLAGGQPLRDWRVGAIVPQRHADPDASELQELLDTIRRSVDNAGFEKATFILLSMLTQTSREYASNIPGFDVGALEAAQETILNRADFRLDMLIYSLGYFGPGGTAIARVLLERDFPVWRPLVLSAANE